MQLDVCLVRTSTCACPVQPQIYWSSARAHNFVTTHTPRLYRKLFSLCSGYSILRGRPLPCFMHEDLITKIFVDREDNNLNAAEEQLRDGLSKFALVEVLYVCVFPLLFVFLFHVLL